MGSRRCVTQVARESRTEASMGIHQKAETRAIIAAIVSIVIAIVAMAIYLRNASAIWLILGRKLLVESGIIATSSFIIFLVGYFQRPMIPLPQQLHRYSNKVLSAFRHLVEAVALSLVFSATAFFTTYALLYTTSDIMGRDLFESYTYPVVGIFAAVVAFLGYIQASSLSAKAIATMLPLFMISGVTVAALTSDDPWWWHNNFSQLGDRTTFAARMFNSTLILAGVCIIIVTYFSALELITAEFTDIDQHRPIKHFTARITVFSVLLALTGVCLIGIGCFRYTPHPVLHNVFARGMSVPTGLLLALLPLLVPRLPKLIYIISDAGIVVAAAALVEWLRGETTLTDVEALCCMLLLAWVILFARQIAAMEADHAQARLMELVENAPEFNGVILDATPQDAEREAKVSQKNARRRKKNRRKNAPTTKSAV